MPPKKGSGKTDKGKKQEHDFYVGTLVFAVCALGNVNIWWPGQVIKVNSSSKGSLTVLFFGDGSHGDFQPGHLHRFEEYLQEYRTQTAAAMMPDGGKLFQKAMEEAMEAADRRHGYRPLTQHRPYDVLDPTSWNRAQPERWVPDPLTPAQARRCECRAAVAWLRSIARQAGGTQATGGRNKAFASALWSYHNALGLEVDTRTGEVKQVTSEATAAAAAAAAAGAGTPGVGNGEAGVGASERRKSVSKAAATPTATHSGVKGSVGSVGGREDAKASASGQVTAKAGGRGDAKGTETGKENEKVEKAGKAEGAGEADRGGKADRSGKVEKGSKVGKIGKAEKIRDAGKSGEGLRQPEQQQKKQAGKQAAPLPVQQQQQQQVEAVEVAKASVPGAVDQSLKPGKRRGGDVEEAEQAPRKKQQTDHGPTAGEGTETEPGLGPAAGVHPQAKKETVREGGATEKTEGGAAKQPECGAAKQPVAAAQQHPPAALTAEGKGEEEEEEEAGKDEGLTLAEEAAPTGAGAHAGPPVEVNVHGEMPSAPRDVPTAPHDAPASLGEVPSAPRDVPSSPRDVPSSPRNAPSAPAARQSEQLPLMHESIPGPSKYPVPLGAEAWAAAAHKAVSDGPLLRPLVSDLLDLSHQEQRLSRLGGTLPLPGLVCSTGDAGASSAQGFGLPGTRGGDASASQQQPKGQQQQGQQQGQQQQVHRQQGQQPNLASVVMALRHLARDWTQCLSPLGDAPNQPRHKSPSSKHPSGKGAKAGRVGSSGAGTSSSQGADLDVPLGPGGCSFRLASAAYLRYREQRNAHTSLHLPPRHEVGTIARHALVQVGAMPQQYGLASRALYDKRTANKLEGDQYRPWNAIVAHQSSRMLMHAMLVAADRLGKGPDYAQGCSAQEGSAQEGSEEGSDSDTSGDSAAAAGREGAGVGSGRVKLSGKKGDAKVAGGRSPGKRDVGQGRHARAEALAQLQAKVEAKRQRQEQGPAARGGGGAQGAPCQRHGVSGGVSESGSGEAEEDDEQMLAVRRSAKHSERKHAAAASGGGAAKGQGRQVEDRQAPGRGAQDRQPSTSGRGRGSDSEDEPIGRFRRLHGQTSGGGQGRGRGSDSGEEPIGRFSRRHGQTSGGGQGRGRASDSGEEPLAARLGKLREQRGSGGGARPSSDRWPGLGPGAGRGHGSDSGEERFAGQRGGGARPAGDRQRASARGSGRGQESGSEEEPIAARFGRLREQGRGGVRPTAEEQRDLGRGAGVENLKAGALQGDGAGARGDKRGEEVEMVEVSRFDFAHAPQLASKEVFRTEFQKWHGARGMPLPKEHLYEVPGFDPYAVMQLVAAEGGYEALSAQGLHAWKQVALQWKSSVASLPKVGKKLQSTYRKTLLPYEQFLTSQLKPRLAQAPKLDNGGRPVVREPPAGPAKKPPLQPQQGRGGTRVYLESRELPGAPTGKARRDDGAGAGPSSHGSAAGHAGNIRRDGSGGGAVAGQAGSVRRDGSGGGAGAVAVAGAGVGGKHAAKGKVEDVKRRVLLAYPEGTCLPRPEDVAHTLRRFGKPDRSAVGSNFVRSLLWIDFSSGALAQEAFDFLSKDRGYASFPSLDLPPHALAEVRLTTTSDYGDTMVLAPATAYDPDRPCVFAMITEPLQPRLNPASTQGPQATSLPRATSLPQAELPGPPPLPPPPLPPPPLPPPPPGRPALDQASADPWLAGAPTHHPDRKPQAAPQAPPFEDGSSIDDRGTLGSTGYPTHAGTGGSGGGDGGYLGAAGGHPVDMPMDAPGHAAASGHTHPRPYLDHAEGRPLGAADFVHGTDDFPGVPMDIDDMDLPGTASGLPGAMHSIEDPYLQSQAAPTDAGQPAVGLHIDLQGQAQGQLAADDDVQDVVSRLIRSREPQPDHGAGGGQDVQAAAMADTEQMQSDMARLVHLLLTANNIV